ncbi:hypothetical protein LUZ60_015389 [Juncus effusus]|nr:hypothetical protein LUZ60_015389 [Juncus effusus]
MGGCCSKQEELDSWLPCKNKKEQENARKFNEEEELREKEKRDQEVTNGSSNDRVPRVILRGSCGYASMYTQQGRKGVNQDTMTIWEDFVGEKGSIFLGVFDGHGPYGHKVARYIRDALPSKLCSLFESKISHDQLKDEINDSNCDQFSTWKNNVIKAFEDLDEELSRQTGIDCICSGTTAVSIVKLREHLIIANLGDSRAVLCTRDAKNQQVAVQLTIDHKPDLPSEDKRITSCKGRVFALEEESDVHRLWLPEEDSPGLAMSRAFGDFCLKDCGLISTPEVSYRRLSEKDEFLVLATDGIWDVLSNDEVIKIVSSTKKRSDSAKKLVDHAVHGWKRNHAASKIDDCAVICIFLKDLTKRSTSIHEISLTKSLSKAIRDEGENIKGLREDYSALDGTSRANSILKLPRFLSSLSWSKRSFKLPEDDD